jgi:hypothetical protein
MVILPRQDGLAAPNGLGQRYMLAEGPGPGLRAVEELREEALHTASPGNVAHEVRVILDVPQGIGPAPFIRLVHIGIAPQQAPHLLGHLAMLRFDLVCLQQDGAAPHRINGRLEPLPGQRSIKSNHRVEVGQRRRFGTNGEVAMDQQGQRRTWRGHRFGAEIGEHALRQCQMAVHE